MTAVGGVAVAGAALAITEASGNTSPTVGKAAPPPTAARAGAGRTTHGGQGTGSNSEVAAVNKVVDGVKLPVSPAIVAENAKTGHAWWVTPPRTPVTSRATQAR